METEKQNSRIFKVKAFARWAKNTGISDRSLKKAVQEIESGLIEADLGSGLYKKRIATGSRGKTAGSGQLSDSRLTTTLSLYSVLTKMN